MNNFTLENLELRHDVITTLIEHPGIYTNRMAADTLGVCIRTIQRLKKIFDGSLESLYHGNYGLRRQLKITTEMKTTIIDTVRALNNKIKETNSKLPPMQYRHAFDLVLDLYGYDLSYSSFIKILTDEGIYSPRSRPAVSPSNGMHVATGNVSVCGEEWQTDGTFKITFESEGIEYCCHSIVDHASNTIIAIYFDYQETTHGYLNVFAKAFKRYGIPQRVCSDNRTSFQVANGDESALSVMSKIFDKLSITQRLTSNPRSNGKVESKNAVIKERVMLEYALAGITTIEEANEKSMEILDKVNRHLHNGITEDNVLRDLPKTFDFEYEMAKIIQRTASKNSTVHYDNVEYILVSKNNKLYKPKVGTKLDIRIPYDHNMFVRHRNTKYYMRPATQAELIKLNIINKKLDKRNIGYNRYTVTWKKKKFHFVDHNGMPVEFERNTSVDFYFSYHKGKFTPLQATIDKAVYAIKEGYPEFEDTYEYETVISRDSMIKIKNFEYALLSKTGSQLTLQKDSEVLVHKKNGVPYKGTFHNKNYKLSNVTISL